MSWLNHLRLSLRPGLFLHAAATMLVGALLLGFGARTEAQSQWVQTGVTGRLIHVPDVDGDRIMNFSMVGYGAGQRSVPDDIPIVIQIDPIAGDNTQHIQNAINFASSLPLQANAFRGVVELGPGKFDVFGHINITASGVVLRGAGDGDDVGANTHIVSQNRTDSFSSATTPVIHFRGSTSGRSYGPQIQIIDKRVPVGAQSLRVASTAGLSVGGMVEVFRPSTQEWIEELGMHLIPDGKHWTAGSRDLRWQRTITRIEGDTVYIDAPITTAIDQQWGGGTVRTYNLPNQIRNVGIENLRGQSLDDREESNEGRTPTFVRFSRVTDGFMRDIETRHFPYAAVYVSKEDGTQHVTIDNVTSRLPSGQVTGGRRYPFAVDGQMSLVQNSHSEQGRHDYVTGSNVTGPIAFVNSTTTGSRSDTGPHHRWGNGLLFDNIAVSGHAINSQNRWTSGSGHGWAGANVVVWNSQANSFIIQSPPTAQSWLIGSTGTINAGNCHLGGAMCAGHYDSHGTRVAVGGTESLYEAQANDAADIREFRWTGGNGNWTDELGWNQAVTPGVYAVSLRDYVVGDFDNFTFDGRQSPDNPFVDPAWLHAVMQASEVPLAGLDVISGEQQNVAFTVQHPLAVGERVVHAYLATSLLQSGPQAGADFVQLFSMAPEHNLSFDSLGWASQLNPNTPSVGVIDMGYYLDKLQSGSVNVWIGENAAVDWAMYTVAVATPKADPVGAMVFLDGGSVLVDSATTPIGGLQNGRPGMASELRIAPAGHLVVNHVFAQANNSKLAIQIAGSGPGQFGTLTVGDEAFLSGTLALELVDGYMPSVGEQFDVLTADGSLLGGFENAIFGDLSGQGVWGLVYEPHAVVAQLLSTTIFGDLNGDGIIDAHDWNLFKAGQGANLAGMPLDEAYFKGDLTGDGKHDLWDFVTFRAAFEAANGTGSFAAMFSTVPEPSTLAMLLLLPAFPWVRLRGVRR